MTYGEQRHEAICVSIGAALRHGGYDMDQENVSALVETLAHFPEVHEHPAFTLDSLADTLRTAARYCRHNLEPIVRGAAVAMALCLSAGSAMAQSVTCSTYYGVTTCSDGTTMSTYSGQTQIVPRDFPNRAPVNCSTYYGVTTCR
jgi:hypothetical protein